jgi:hypothetical protein
VDTLTADDDNDTVNTFHRFQRAYDRFQSTDEIPVVPQRLLPGFSPPGGFVFTASLQPLRRSFLYERRGLFWESNQSIDLKVQCNETGNT